MWKSTAKLQCETYFSAFYILLWLSDTNWRKNLFQNNVLEKEREKLSFIYREVLLLIYCIDIVQFNYSNVRTTGKLQQQELFNWIQLNTLMMPSCLLYMQNWHQRFQLRIGIKESIQQHQPMQCLAICLCLLLDKRDHCCLFQGE